MDFDLLFVAQSVKVTNWLTPVWLLSAGFAFGFILVLLTMLKVFIFQRIPFFNGVWENPSLRWIFGILTSLVYVGLVLGFMYWRGGDAIFGPALIMPMVFIVPVCFILGFGVWSLISKRMIGETGSLFREGFAGWLNMVCIAAILFCAGGFALAQFDGFGVLKFVDAPMEFVDSLKRLPATGQFTTDGEKLFRSKPKTVEIAPSPKTDEDGNAFGGQKVLVDFDGQEVKWLLMQSDQRLELSAGVAVTEVPSAAYIFDLAASEEPTVYLQRLDGKGRIPPAQIDHFYVRNTGKTPANLKLSWSITPLYNEVALIPFMAGLVLLTFLLYYVVSTMCPKIFAIAHSTFKTEVGQPLFMLVMIVGGVFILASVYVPYNTFGEDIKMFKDSGLTLIRVLAIFLAIWAASKSVAEEIEGRTALTVLSKPVGRRQFIVGKFTGISMAIAVMFVILGMWFIIWTAYKPIYDFQEASKGLCEWPTCYREAVHVGPGLFLCFLEVLVFVAVSVAISTRFGILANFLICFSIYVLGHLTPLLVQSSFAAFEPVVVFGQLVAIVFPVLNHYDVQAAINTNSSVPFDYLGWSMIYTALYGSMALLLALVFFEDRDLA
jgi:ABC-type transport system involved in multi-copper enzyme maturation permease subunit